MSKLIWAAVLAGALGATSAQAEDAKLDGYLQVGTEGIGAGVAHHFSDKHAVRFEGNYASFGYNLDYNDNEYDTTLEPGNVGVFYDYYPETFHSTFRVSAGLAVLFTEASGDVKGGTINLDGNNYVIPAGESVSLSIEPQVVAPYLGVGWGRPMTRDGKVSFFADLGVYVTSYDATLRATPGMLAAIGAPGVAEDTLRREEANINDELDNNWVYPVAKMGISWRF